MFLRDDEPLDAQALNLTSLTDLVFLLLVFFLCATTFLDPERALGLELPSASHASERRESDEVIVNVGRDGAVTIGGRVVRDEQLVDELRRACGGRVQTPVTIRGDRQAAHADIVRVMDACGAVGLFNLGIGALEDI